MNLLELLPKGKLWQGKNTKALFKTLALSMKRLQEEAESILVECFPDTAKQILEDWKRLTQAKSVEGVISTLAATGGNTEEYFLMIARKFEPNCKILNFNQNDEFIVGRDKSGMNLGVSEIPSHCVRFFFPVRDRIMEAEKILNQLKPAHVRFEYIYQR